MGPFTRYPASMTTDEIKALPVEQKILIMENIWAMLQDQSQRLTDFDKEGELWLDAPLMEDKVWSVIIFISENPTCRFPCASRPALLQNHYPDPRHIAG